MRHDGLVDALVVDQRTHRAAHAGVIVGLVLDAQGNVVEGPALHGLGAHLVGLLQGFDVGCGHALGQVQVTALDHQAQRLRLGHVAHDDALELGRATPVTVVAAHQDHIVGAPVIEDEWAAAGGVGSQPGAAHVVALLVLLDHFAVEDKGAGRGRQGVEHQHRVGWPRQLEDKGVLVGGAQVLGGVAGGEAVSLPCRGQGQIELEHALQRPGDVFGSQRVARLEGHAGAQREGQGLAVVADLPALRQGRYQLVRLLDVLHQQHVVEVGIDLGDIQAGGGGRVERQQVDHAHADDQLVGGGLGESGRYRRHRQRCGQDPRPEFGENAHVR
ncbi:hypothetical protein D3C76_854450 [compost metagenome]